MHAGPTKRRWALAALLGVAVVLAAIPALRSAGSRTLAAAPALPRTRLSGPRVSLASLRGRPVVVNFWASWCGPCAREARQLERFARLAPEHAALVGVDLNDSRAGGEAFVRRFSLSYPILRYRGNALSARYHLVGLPTSIVIDPQGRIVATLSGPQTVASLRAALGTAAGVSKTSN